VDKATVSLFIIYILLLLDTSKTFLLIFQPRFPLCNTVLRLAKLILFNPAHMQIQDGHAWPNSYF